MSKLGDTTWTLHLKCGIHLSLSSPPVASIVFSDTNLLHNSSLICIFKPIVPRHIEARRDIKADHHHYWRAEKKH